METRTIGSLEVSLVGLGTNNFGLMMEERAVPPVVAAALDAGITLFDTSDSYGESELRLGKALGRHRDEVVLATKFASPVDGGTGGAKPEYVRVAVERSLRELGTDHLDLYQIHRPDPETPIADTLGALNELITEGKVRELGCSNFSAEQLREAEAAVAPGAARFICVQNQYNLLHRDDEAEVLPTCEKLGLAYLPFFPLASGLLTGKYTRGEKPAPGTRLAAWGDASLTDENFDLVDRLTAWARNHDHTITDLAFAWLAATPVVASVIAGATTAEQVKANVAAGGWTLTPAEKAEVDDVATR